MIIQREQSNHLRPDQVRAMAQGLYWLAQIDGVTEQERDLIQAFLKDGGLELKVESLAALPFSLEGLLFSLDTIFLRRTFLRSCVLLARADGTVTAQEMAELRRLAQALGIDEPLDSLVSDLHETSIT